MSWGTPSLDAGRMVARAGHALPSREKRWIVLASDGRHVTIGRHVDPTPEMIEQAAFELRKGGLGGWLAITEGRYYEPGDELQVLAVRPLAEPASSWDDAVAMFMAMRLDAISG